MKIIPYKPIEGVGKPMETIPLLNFAGGVQLSKPATALMPDEFTEIENFYIDDQGYLQSRPGYKPDHYGDGDSDLGAQGLSFFKTTISGTDYTLVAIQSGSDVIVKYWNGSAWAAIETFAASTEVIYFLEYAVNESKDILFFNGTDTPRRWNPTDGDSAIGLTAPTVQPNSVTPGLVANYSGIGTTSDEFYYKYTYFYDNGTQYGESNGLAVTTTADVDDATYAVSLVFAAVADEDVTTQVYVYRSRHPSGPFYYVGKTDTSDSGTFTFVDNEHVGEEGVMLPVDDGAVPNLKQAVVTAGRIVGIDGDIPEKIVWTEPGYPDLFPALNYTYLQERAIGLVVFNRTTYILSEKAVYAVPGSDFDSQVPVKVSDKGCISARTIKNVTTGICWLSEDNVYWANFNIAAEDGDYAVPIGTPIQDIVSSMSSSQWEKATGGFHNEKYYVTLPSYSSGVSYDAWCWNMRPALRMMKQGRWAGWTRMGWYANDIIGFKDVLYTLCPEKQSSDEYYIYSHNASALSGKIWDYNAYGTGDFSDRRAAVSARLQTGLMIPSVDMYETILYRTSIMAESTGGTYTLTAKLNREDGGGHEYIKTLTFSFLDGYAESQAEDWFSWDEFNDGGVWPYQETITGGTVDKPDGTHTEYEVADSSGFTVGDSVIISGVSANSAYNSTQTVTAVVDDTQDAIQTDLDSTGLDAPADGEVIQAVPVWPQLKQVHGKASKRWPKGTKGNIVQLTLQISDLGQTKLSNITTYFKTISRAI